MEDTTTGFRCLESIVKDGLLYANVQFPGLEIRYTTDGSEPSINSLLYNGPVKIPGTVRLKSFVKNGLSSRTSVVLSAN